MATSEPTTDEPGSAARLEEFRLFIDGKSVDSVSGRTFESLNPYTGRPWARVADGTPEDVDAAVAAARTAFDGEWGAMTGFGRAASCAARRRPGRQRRPAGRARGAATPGKLMREMLGQMAGLSAWFLYFSGLADKLEGTTVPLANRTTSATPARSRSASSVRSLRGTARCCC